MGIVAFSIGDVNVYWYGIIITIAILIGMIITWINVYLRGQEFSRVVDILLFGIPVGFLFGRLGQVILHWDNYQNNWSEILQCAHGGISIYGAFLGFILVVFLYTSAKRLSFWFWLDILVPAIVFALMLDQLGHFVLQVTVGTPLPLNIPNDHSLVQYIEYDFRPSGFEGYEYFRPVALYQAIAQFVVFVASIILSFLQIRRNNIKQGTIFLISIFFVALIRFFCGFLYLGAPANDTLHFGQITCLLGSMLCLCIWCLRKYQRQNFFFGTLFKFLK
ncbi:phosphatidylglycerol:prolipoprotein diacylglycerol transferase [Propionispira arboris]|uniref:Phosphatidylglycerol:prolipoprotein diacylglycerol transferase n=1 Tax=Propionispira arboris TaxID=84035 RepID=A0A1H7ARD2_9FIRM|nr:prolipoprotein diacylglyceryl transferase family protein [Propionispira arboris]SEJ63565.1 phosphatidylglycerol:prolipoprotein diacylglycerol transferase [Propionispira arboris]